MSVILQVNRYTIPFNLQPAPQDELKFIIYLFIYSFIYLLNFIYFVQVNSKKCWYDGFSISVL